jgi:hydroxymethylpyrimidine pyrophosphatase-like HAD family hydrolase
VGDQINDVTMIRGAGLGIAMGNAIEAVRAVADRVTTSNAEAGVARAIEMVLCGEW